jgi:hypothetical protein
MWAGASKEKLRAVVPARVWAAVRYWYYRFRFSDRGLIERQFRDVIGRNPNLADPQTFNEKIQWLKLHWRDELALRCADKAAAREYVAERVGPHVLNRSYGVFRRVSDIPWEDLPRQFVMKATHASGWNLICEDRESMDWRSVRTTVALWLRRSHFWKTREWVYKDIPPGILIEEYLRPGKGLVPFDYKVFCFNGRPMYIQVDMGRYERHTRNLYDTSWRLLPVSIKRPSDRSATPERPPLPKLLTYSAALAEPFPHVRVDWFLWDGELRFGEMTFFHGSGHESFSPAEWDLEFGRQLDLSGVTAARRK